MTIRRGTATDAREAARLHASSITEGFLPRLGSRFLTYLYKRIARDDQSFLFVADTGNGGLDGMIAGTSDVGALYRRFARHEGIAAATVAAPRIVRNLRPVFETWRYGRGADDDLPAAELLAVAVDDRARGRGVGHALVGELNGEFARRGTRAVKVVVGATNEGALRLYRACGYRDAATIEVHHDVSSKVLVWSPSSR